MIYQTEKTIRDNGDKIEDATKKDVEEKISALKEANKTEDMEDIKKKTDELMRSAQKIGEQVYKANQTKTEDNPPKADSDKSEKPDEPIEGDYQENK